MLGLNLEQIMMATLAMIKSLPRSRLQYNLLRVSDEHIFIFDNACTHAKHADDALSACGLPKHTSKPGSNWMLKVKRHDLNGTLINEHICTHDATFANGTPQCHELHRVVSPVTPVTLL